MEYTGKFKKMHSAMLKRNVVILEYKSTSKFPYCDCTKCGKPIVKKMYVVQDEETDIEEMFLGSECIKKFR